MKRAGANNASTPSTQPNKKNGRSNGSSSGSDDENSNNSGGKSNDNNTLPRIGSHQFNNSRLIRDNKENNSNKNGETDRLADNAQRQKDCIDRNNNNNNNNNVCE